MAKTLIELNGETFFKKEATALARKILEKRTILTGKDYAIALDIFHLRFPSRSQETPKLKVDTHSMFHGNCFYYLSSNGEWIDFSFTKAFMDSKRRIYKDVTKAFRNSVLDQTQGFKMANLPNHPKLKYMSTNDVHVDHVFPLKLLIQNFLDKYKYGSLDTVSIKKNQQDMYILSDYLMYRRWRIFHKRYAELQLLTTEENLRKGGKVLTC